MDGTILTNVAGVTYCNEDGTDRQSLVKSMAMGNTVDLRDEASVEYPEAIGVYNADGQRLGFLPSDVARHIRRCGYGDVNGELWGSVEFVGHRPGAPWGMQIEVHDYMGKLKPMAPAPAPKVVASSATAYGAQWKSEERREQKSSGIAWKIVAVLLLLLIGFAAWRFIIRPIGTFASWLK